MPPGRNQTIGCRGEQLAAAFLQRQGYALLARNFRVAGGEIDLVAEREGVIVFVEVKTRTSQRYGDPAAAVTRRKQERISRAALAFLARHGLCGRPARFDVVAVSLARGRPPVIEQFTNAFELAHGF